MEAKPSWTTSTGETQLDQFAKLARQVIVMMDGFSQPTMAAIELAGWHSGHAFALRAELARAVECAEKARRGTTQASTGR